MPYPLTERGELKGPSGFIQYCGESFVVDYGRIYQGDSFIGRLFDDGYLKDTSGILGNAECLRSVEDVPGLIFRGIDSNGEELNLPNSSVGPSGILTYNGVLLNVIHGRLSTPDHDLVGSFDDQGILSLRDHQAGRWQLSDATQLNFVFEGKKSTGQAFRHEFGRPLYRKDKSYVDNEIIRYFSGFDALSSLQKKYVLESMSLWAATGLLQVVRKSEGDASLGNVKHGAAGVTGVRSGNVTLDRQEFEREIELYKQFGALAVVSKGIKNYTEVRVNLVVAHEFGHQLEFCLSAVMQEKVASLYEARRKSCDRLHQLPTNYDGFSELLLPEHVAQRHFISGYARASNHEYWAECVAAFSIKESREELRQIDPAIYEMLMELVLHPNQIMRIVFSDTILALQFSLRLGGEFTNDLLG